MDKKSNELLKWEELKGFIGDENVTLGRYFSYQIRNTPRRILFALSRYKFAAKMIGNNKNVLEVGCNEGLGTVILAEFAKSVTGVDIDSDAIADAERSFGSAKLKFISMDFIDARIGEFDSVVSFDVIEHIYPEAEEKFFNSICSNLKERGICIIGTPNETSDIYASEVSKKGHVNLYSWERLKSTMEKYFEHVFLFSSNDELVHTGFYPMAQYLIVVGVNKIISK